MNDLLSTLDMPTLTPAWKVFLNPQRTIWCIVDDADYEWLAKFKWNWGRNGHRHWKRKLYAKRNYGASRQTFWMHREIQKVADPRRAWFMDTHMVHHINRQTLDNRRCNLIWATAKQNSHRLPANYPIPSLKWIWDNLCVDASLQYEEIPF